MRHILWHVFVTIVILGLLAVFAPCAQAGPPLICWPFDIGNAHSLPWGGSGWHDSLAEYNLNHLADDTLALLAPQTPVLVRMETLRRAVIYASKDAQAARDLFARIAARAGESQKAGKSEAALYRFDYGYLIEAYKQVRLANLLQDGTERDGYGYEVAKNALASRGDDAEMEFGAALIASSESNTRELGRRHLEKAAAGASEGSLLAKNLVTHCHLVGVQASSLAGLRQQMAASKN